MSDPIRFAEIRSGMKLWDDKEKRWAEVLRVYLWEDILRKNPNRYFAEKPITRK